MTLNITLTFTCYNYFTLFIQSVPKMSLVKLDLSKALVACPATVGIGPISLQYQMEELLPCEEKQQVSITLNDGANLRFLVHQDNGKTVLTSLTSLASGCYDGVSVDSLPEILAKLNESNVKCDALQFPHAFKVQGRITGKAYRAHFNHLVIYKDSSNQINASIIDSTVNPIGVSNPMPILGWLASSSLLSGEELLQTKLIRLLKQPALISSLQALSNLAEGTTVNVTDPIYTYKQPSCGDKRCAIYTLNAMTSLINYFTSSAETNTRGISGAVTAAHQELNEPDMMAISFPETHAKACGM